MPVAQMVGHEARGAVAHLRKRRVDARLAGVALRRERYVRCSLSQVDTVDPIGNTIDDFACFTVFCYAALGAEIEFFQE